MSVANLCVVFGIKKLVTLDLQSSNIGDKGAKHIADALKDNIVSDVCLFIASDIPSHVDSSES